MVNCCKTGNFDIGHPYKGAKLTFFLYNSGLDKHLIQKGQKSKALHKGKFPYTNTNFGLNDPWFLMLHKLCVLKNSMNYQKK